MLKEREFDPNIFESPRICELVEFVKCHKCLHLFNLSVLVAYQNKVRDFYYAIKLSEDCLIRTSMVQGVDICLNESVLGEILDVLVERIRYVTKTN